MASDLEPKDLSSLTVDEIRHEFSTNIRLLGTLRDRGGHALDLVPLVRLQQEIMDAYMLFLKVDQSREIAFAEASLAQMRADMEREQGNSHKG